MRPAVPADGDEVLAAWAGDVVDYIGGRWEYVPLFPGGVVSRGTPPGATPRLLELTELPANDPTVVAAVVGPMIRETSTTSLVLNVLGPDLVNRYGFVGTTGYAARGAGLPTFIVPVGGTNGRSIGVSSSASSTATYWLTVFGYWRVVSAEPAEGSTDGVARGMGRPVDPAPGDDVQREWAADLLRYAGRSWRYHPLPEVNGPSYTAIGSYSWDVSAILPADRNVVAASVLLRMRGSDANSRSVYVFDDGGAFAGACWTAGVAARYTITGPWPVMLRGGRSIRFDVGGGTVQEALCVLVGYWTADSEVDE